MAQDGQNAPPGWYPTPDGTQRYWDGAQWTEAVAPAGGQVGEDPLPGPAPVGEPAETRPWFKKKRFILPIAAVLLIGVLSQLGGDDESTTAAETPTTAATEETTAAEVEETSEPDVTTEPEEEPEEVEEVEEPVDDGPDLTPGQDNALRAAQNYLETMPFSRQGLIDQLSSEFGNGFDVEDATFAVDNLTVDWQEQAVRQAESYLETMPFSRQGLIDQLSSEFGSQHTLEDATYAVDNITVDWNEQAVLAAESYLETMPFSRQGLIEQLSSEFGSQFTVEQATHAVDELGL